MKGFFNQVVDRSKQVATNVASNVQHLVEQNALGTPVGRHPGRLKKHRMGNLEVPDPEPYA
jgi:hypothetical protein